MIENFSDTNLPENQIEGVIFKDLRTFNDGRGFFREIIRATDGFFGEGFGQWSHSKMQLNTVKAWHYHHEQVDWWYVALGAAQTVLIDHRPESPTFERKLEFILGDSDAVPGALTAVVKIPPGVLHGCKVLTATADLFYITSRTYNPDDEGRIPFSTPLAGHRWGDEQALIVSDNDRKEFVPRLPRRGS